MSYKNDILEYLEMKIIDHTIRDDEYGLYINSKNGYDITYLNFGICSRVYKELSNLNI